MLLSCSTFVVQTDCEVPDELISLTLLLMLPTPEWEKTQRKEKLPKPKITLDVLPIITSVIAKRLAEYPTTVEVRHLPLLVHASVMFHYL